MSNFKDLTKVVLDNFENIKYCKNCGSKLGKST